MANKKKQPPVISGTVEGITNILKRATEKLHKKIDPNERDYEITAASIKDLQCKYSITITGEACHGWKNTENGDGIVDEDMLTAFANLRPHLACLDEAYKLSGIAIGSNQDGIEPEFVNIDNLRSHEITGNYTVTGFRLTGGAGNESVTLMGNKYISLAGDHMELKTPKIPISNGSSYTWYNELREAIDIAREEVALYREGKYTEKEEREPKHLPNQQELFEQGKLEGDELDDFLAKQSSETNQYNQDEEL